MKSFAKSLFKVATSGKGKFEDSLFKFSKEICTSPNNGRKKGKAIPVQSTAISRRTHKVRGRLTCRAGRKRKPNRKRTVFEVRELDEVVRHALPSQKVLKTKHPHNFTASVAGNRRIDKKH